jgi:hypothetical protein
MSVRTLFIVNTLVLFLAACASTQAPYRYADLSSTPTSGLRVAVIGDMQRTGVVEVWRERNEKQQAALLRQLGRERPDVLISLGDHVFWGPSNADWAYFDKVMTPIREQHIPVLPILGNHDYFGSDEEMLDHVRRRFPAFDSTYYSVVIDSVAYVMLNTNTSDIGMKNMAAQHRWFLLTMYRLDRDPGVQFIVVCGHHPPFTNSTIVWDDELLQSYFVPAFTLSKKGAIWFSGHCHAYEHFYIDAKHFVVSGGGGGPRQRLLTEQYAQYPDHYDGPMVRPFHYCIVQRMDSILTFTMQPLLPSSVQRDSFAIKRPY